MPAPVWELGEASSPGLPPIPEFTLPLSPDTCCGCPGPAWVHPHPAMSPLTPPGAAEPGPQPVNISESPGGNEGAGQDLDAGLHDGNTCWALGESLFFFLSPSW